MLIYAALLGILTAGIATSLSLGLHYFQNAQAAADLQKAAQDTVRRLISEMRQCQVTAVYTAQPDGAPAGVVFTSPYDASGALQLDPNMNPLYQNWICYYLDSGTGQLMRKQMPLSTPQSFVPSPVPGTDQFVPLPGGTVIARSMTDLTFTVAGTVVITATFHQQASSMSGQSNDNAVTIVDAVRLKTLQ
jgi:hypothetical protein